MPFLFLSSRFLLLPCVKNETRIDYFKKDLGSHFRLDIRNSKMYEGNFAGPVRIGHLCNAYCKRVNLRHTFGVLVSRFNFDG